MSMSNAQNQCHLDEFAFVLCESRLLCLIIYTFAILFTDAVIDHAFYNEPDPTLEAHFGRWA